VAEEEGEEDFEGIEDIFPLSATQTGMLFESLASPGSGAYLGFASADSALNLSDDYGAQHDPVGGA